QGGLARGLALDPGRPVVASVSTTPGGRKAVERVIALEEHPPPLAATERALHAAVDDLPSAGFSLRFVLPSTDVAGTLHAATDILDFVGWQAGTPPDGVELFYAEPEQRAFMGLSRGASVVTVDVVIPAGGQPGAI